MTLALIRVLIFIVVFYNSALFATGLEIDVIDQNFNSSNRTILTEEDIKKNHPSDLIQLLSTQANLNIVSTGLRPNSIYVRGADASHVLILIDNVPAYDPSNVQRNINLNLLNQLSIKKIEIIKGSQSVMYGGQALAAVIKIDTKPINSDKSTKFLWQASPLSTDLNFYNQRAINEKITFSQAFRAAGLAHPSQAESSRKYYPEWIKSFDGQLVYRPNQKLEILSKLNYLDSDSEIASTDASFKAIDTDNFISKNRTLGMTFLMNQSENYSLSGTYQYNRRLLYQSALDSGGVENDQDYEGHLYAGRFDHNLYQNQTLNLNWGISYIEEIMGSRIKSISQEVKNRNYQGLYLKSDYHLTSLLEFEFGLRKELQGGRKLSDTYQVGFNWDKWLKFEYSTGFKSPSLFQLFAGTYANPDLRPELASSASLSFEFNPQPFSTQITLFKSSYENLITTFGTPTRYQNIAKSEVQGIEAYFAYLNNSSWTNYSVSLTYQEPKDLQRNDWLTQRPLRSATARITQNISENFYFLIEAQHIGSRTDKSSGTGYETVDDYTLLNSMFDWRLSETSSCFLRVNNLSASNYQTSYGHYTTGIRPKAGLQITF